MSLADRYHEIMAFRKEALSKYRANETSVMTGPPARAYLPRLSRAHDAPRAKRLGPLAILDRPPLWQHVDRAIAATRGPVNVLEIGPGNGDLCTYLRARYGARIERYLGIERDPNVSGGYERIASLADSPTEIDVVIASEVIEHMSADVLYEDLLTGFASRLSPNATLVLSTPNPVAPGGIARDFTHVQNYPWYDLYALLRLAFEDVAIHRAFYLWSLSRMAFCLPRALLCPVLELDWCDNLIAVARRPRPATG